MKTFKDHYGENILDVQAIVEKLNAWRTVIEAPPLNFEWIYTSSLRRQIQEFLDKQKASSVRLAQADVDGIKYNSSIQMESTDPRYGWGDIIPAERRAYSVYVEYPLYPDVNDRVTFNDLSSYAISRLTDEKLKRLCTASKTTFVFKLRDYPSDIMDNNIKELRNQFVMGRAYEKLNGRFNVAEAINTLEGLGMPKSIVVQMKRHFGLEIDPNEIDNKTLVDLL